MRVLLLVDAFQELCFETSIDFKGGEFYEGIEVAISLRYEKLFGYCDGCGSLCHEVAKCPLNKDKGPLAPQGNNGVMQGNGAWVDGGKHDERARSYKGVVNHGSGGHQNRERDGRDFYGKGKGKEEGEWTKVGEKGNKKFSASRGHQRGEGGSSRNNFSHRNDTRYQRQGDTSGAPPGNVGLQRDQLCPAVETREEGEITETREEKTLPPSKEFQDQLAKTQADGAEVVLHPVDAVLASPRKRAAAKPGTRNGEGKSQQEKKGSSNRISSQQQP